MRSRLRPPRPGSSGRRRSSAGCGTDGVLLAAAAELEPLGELRERLAARAVVAAVGAVERVDARIDRRAGDDRAGALGDDGEIDAAPVDHDPVAAADQSEA